MPKHGKIEGFDPSESNWSSYIERLGHYFEANDIADAKKKSTFLAVCGPSTFELAKNLVQPDKLKDKSYADILKALQNHYAPAPSPIVQRFKFNSRQRQLGESVAVYVAELRALGEHCDFGNTLNDMIRDRLVCGVNDRTIQRRLLQEPKLTYQTAYDIATAMESASKNAQDLAKPIISSQVQQMRHSLPSRSHRISHPNQPRNPLNSHNPLNPNNTLQPTLQPNQTRIIQCHRCGTNGHLATVCRFKDSICHSCGKRGHLSKVCNSKKGHQKSPIVNSDTSQGQPNVHTVQSSSLPPLDVIPQNNNIAEPQEYTINNLPSCRSPPVVTISVNNSNLKMEVDTGAALSLISEETYKKQFQSIPLQPSDVQLHTYSGEGIEVLGNMMVTVEYQAQSAVLPLVVVRGCGSSLIGRNWLMTIRIDWNSIFNVTKSNTIDSTIQRFPSVFNEGLGLFKDGTAKIQVSSAPPKFFKPRPVSYHLRAKVDTELDRLQKEGIIVPVTHSNWAAPIVPVLKPDGTVRICGDYKVSVNTVAKADTYPIPRIEDLFSKLSGGTIFSKLDLAHAYQQIGLDEHSSTLTTINTHRGLFRYTRLPFSISAAPSIFQRILDTILADIPRVCVYLDDILISGVDEEDHLRTLQKVLTKLEAAGLTLKKSKCEFGLNSVSYLGHVIDASGLHPSPDKVRAIQEAPIPKNITELKAFLGLINYYHKFISNLSHVLSPLYRLLSKNCPWTWKDEQSQAFSNAKNVLQSSSVLVHFDPSKSLVVSADASPYGVGAVLSHKMEDGTEKPISFASRTLSKAEQKYAQIEKEALAIIFAVRKFHQYLHGRHFCIKSDHKPLQYLFKETNQVPVMASSRIQRWALILGAYNYSIRHSPGSTIPHADALSRLPLPDTHESTPVPSEIDHLINQLSTSIVTASMIRQWTRQDPTMSRVRKLI